MLYAPYEPPLCVAHNSGPSSKARTRAGAFYGSCGCDLTRVNGGALGKLGKWRCWQAKSASVPRQGERRSARTRERIWRAEVWLGGKTYGAETMARPPESWRRIGEPESAEEDAPFQPGREHRESTPDKYVSAWASVNVVNRPN